MSDNSLCFFITIIVIYNIDVIISNTFLLLLSIILVLCILL